MRRMSIVLVTMLILGGSSFAARRAAAENAESASGGEDTAMQTLKGKVLERVDAQPYSYLKLSTSSGEVWAAVPQTNSAVGSEVTVTGAFPMKDFESKTLNRKFDVVYFGTLGGSGAMAVLSAHGGDGSMPDEIPAVPKASGAAMPPGHPAIPDGGGMAAQHKAAGAGPSDIKEVKVEKASGPDAHTVSEIYAQRSALKQKTVAVRGQVVKFNAGIMGRNWIHLRDGSGSQDKGDNDITITSQDAVAVGDVVTAKGTVQLEKDFGAGYAYPVIVEEAQVSK